MPRLMRQKAFRVLSMPGWHGQMKWLEERMHWRGDPTALWPEARSVIMLAEAYTPPFDPLELLERPECGSISVYARNRDYHDIVKKRLKRFGRWLVSETGAEIKVFVDTAPVMGKTTGTGGRPWLAGQAYKPCGSWPWQLVFPRFRFYDPRT